jgi:hypothetical protein
LKKDKEETVDEEELKVIKKREKVLDWLWGSEEKRTILGLLKGRKMKKELKEHLKEKETKK